MPAAAFNPESAADGRFYGMQRRSTVDEEMGAQAARMKATALTQSLQALRSQAFFHLTNEPFLS